MHDLFQLPLANWPWCSVIKLWPLNSLSELALLCDFQDARDPCVRRSRLSCLCSVHGVRECSWLPTSQVASHFRALNISSCSFFALPHETEESFVQRKIFLKASLSEESALIVGQVFGFYSLLNSVRALILPEIYNFNVANVSIIWKTWPFVKTCLKA